MTDDCSTRFLDTLPVSNILSQITDAVIVIDLEGLVLFWNPGAERLYGWTGAEALGRNALELLGSEFPCRYDELLEQCLREGAWEGEVTDSHRDGGSLTVSSRWSLLRDVNGVPAARMVITTDLTCTKLAQDKLRRAEADAEQKAAELIAILEVIPAATFIAHDPDCHTVTNSRAAMELLRLGNGANGSKSASLEERLAGFRVMRNGRELSPEELPIRRAAATGEAVFDSDITVEFKDGTSRDLLGNAVPLIDRAGAVRGAVGAFIDVTARNLAEKSACQGQALLQAVLDATPDFVFLKDCEGRYLAINAAAANAVGAHAADILGKDDYAIFPAALAEQFIREDQEVIAAGGYFTFECDFPAKAERLQINTVKSVCRDASGQIIGVVGIARDFTNRKSLESALRQREHELTEAHRLARLGTWRWNRISDVVTWSDEIHRIFGSDPDLPAPTYEEQSQLYTPESLARLDAAVRRSIVTGESYEVDLEVKFPDGSTKWITARGEVESYANGEAVQLRGTVQEITERKRGEEQLAMSESRYRSLVHACSNIVWTTNADGLPVDDLPQWRAFTGQSPEEVAGRGTGEALHPDDRERTVRAMTEAIASGNTYQIEHRVRRHDGVYRNMLARAVPVRDVSGKVIEWIGMHTDITEQRLAEQALRRSESRFRKLFESDLIGSHFSDKVGGFTEGNDEFLRILGCTREDLAAGKVRWDQMTPPEYHALDHSHIVEAEQRGSCTPYEKEYIRKDGSRVPVLVGYARMEGSQDEFIGFIMDLSAQKRAEEASREREQRFSALAESLPELVWVTNAAGENIYSNQRIFEFTGIPAKEYSGLVWQSLFHPDDLPGTMEQWNRCLQTGEPYLNEYRLRRHDGVYRYFLARAVAVRNEDGQIERWLGSSTDIHDRKLAEEALRRTEKLAVAGRLAASIAHEINNPLAAVTNCIYLALTDPALRDVTRDYLKTAEQELARVAHVATQTLRFHKQSSAPALADLSGIMESVFSLFAPRFRVSSIVVEREYETVEKLFCYNDELRQVFANLIGNALDAIARGGRLRIRIKDARAWDNSGVRGVKVIIADTGHGIPVDLRKQVFEPFVTTKDSTGTGLGLWVTEGIIRKHQGSMAMRSSTDPTGHGTVFSLFFPLGGLASSSRSKKMGLVAG